MIPTIELLNVYNIHNYSVPFYLHKQGEKLMKFVDRLPHHAKQPLAAHITQLVMCLPLILLTYVMFYLCMP